MREYFEHFLLVALQSANWVVAQVDVHELWQAALNYSLKPGTYEGLQVGELLDEVVAELEGLQLVIFSEDLQLGALQPVVVHLDLQISV